MRTASLSVTAIAALCGCATATVAGAAESRWDLRGRVGGATVLDEIAGVGQDGRPGLAVSGMAMWGTLLGTTQRWGLCAGGGLFLDAHRGKRASLDATYTAHGFEATVGGLYQLDALWHLELRTLGRLGQGRLKADSDNNNTVVIDYDRDDYAALGLVVGGFYTFPSRLQLGVEAAWMEWEGDSTGGGETLTAKGDGLSVIGTIGYRF